MEDRVVYQEPVFLDYIYEVDHPYKTTCMKTSNRQGTTEVWPRRTRPKYEDE